MILTPAAKSLLQKAKDNDGLYSRPAYSPATQLVKAGLAIWVNGTRTRGIELTMTAYFS